MSDWKPFSERPPEEQAAMERALRDKCFNMRHAAKASRERRKAAVDELTRNAFRCEVCGQWHPIAEKRRQLRMTFADMCPECCRTGGERPH